MTASSLCYCRATKADVRLLYAEKVVGDLECTSVRQANKRLLQARQESAVLQVVLGGAGTARSHSLTPQH